MGTVTSRLYSLCIASTLPTKSAHLARRSAITSDESSQSWGNCPQKPLHSPQSPGQASRNCVARSAPISDSLLIESRTVQWPNVQSDDNKSVSLPAQTQSSVLRQRLGAPKEYEVHISRRIPTFERLESPNAPQRLHQG